ncbi:hypothetical protein DXG01_010416 [Tephrocybe rancida]|nr:hypothetical protein DXG01_010416 [Tephrocybe rancida]
MSLPDEIIKEILAPALHVSDEDFSSTSDVSSFNNSTESTSAYLAVCKSWLRVATPLLYNVVVIRSKAQAKALEKVLKGNKLLGTFIRKLRVEGGYGDPVFRIFRFATNVKDLWLTLKYTTNESVTGLCKGLPRMNPRRVIFCDPDYLEVWGSFGSKDNWNKPVRDLLQVLPVCFRLWKSLSLQKVLEIPYRDTRSPKAESVIQAMLCARHLKILVLTQPQMSVDFLMDFVEGLHLSDIRVVFRPTGDASEDNLVINETKVLQAQVQHEPYLADVVQSKYPSADSAVNTPSEAVQTIAWKNSSFVPLQGVPSKIREHIWSRILFFAMSVDEEKVEQLIIPEGKPERIDYSEQIAKVNYLLVSKIFNIVEIFHKHPSLASHVHSIYTYFSYDRDETRPMSLLPSLFALTSNLIRVISPSKGDSRRQRSGIFTYKVFEALAMATGSTLRELSGQLIHSTGPLKPATPIFAMTALRHLEWNTPLRLSYNAEDVPQDALPNLETLWYSAYTPSFLGLLEHMNLPSLRHVVFLRSTVNTKMAGTREFLFRQGSKVLTLEIDTADGVFASCPSLQSLCVTKAAEAHSFTQAHACLTKLTFTREVSLGQIKTAYKLIGEVDFGLFPALKEIEICTIE